MIQEFVTRWAARAVVLATGLGVLTIWTLSVPGASGALPWEFERTLRRVCYQSWGMFAPPPRISPTLLVKCQQEPARGELSSAVTYDLVRCFGAGAARHRFSVATRMSGYTYALAGAFFDADGLRRADPAAWKKLEARALALTSLFCARQDGAAAGPMELAVAIDDPEVGYKSVIQLGTFFPVHVARSLDPLLTAEACRTSD